MSILVSTLIIFPRSSNASLCSVFYFKNQLRLYSNDIMAKKKQFTERISLVSKAGCEPTRIIFSQCDLSKFKSIRACAECLSAACSRIDILVNNAGVMFYPKFELTEDKHEMAWQSNHLAPNCDQTVLPLVRNAEEGRIVLLTSDLLEKSGPLDLAKIDAESSFGRFAPYNRSKLATVMYARESGVTNSVHPGETMQFRSFISNRGQRSSAYYDFLKKHIACLLMVSVKEGIQTALYLAMSREVKGESGGYYADCARAKESKDALDDEACKRLYDYSKKAVGMN